MSFQLVAPFMLAAKSNNGIHPTANSAAFIRQLERLFSCVRGG